MQITERDFQDQAQQLAPLSRWLAYYTYDSRRSQAGFPDLALMRERVVHAELARIRWPFPKGTARLGLGRLACLVGCRRGDLNPHALSGH